MGVKYSEIYPRSSGVTILLNTFRKVGDIPIIYYTYPRAKANSPKTTTTIYDRTGTPV